MNNANTPAMPQNEPERYIDGVDPTKGVYDAIGLTKREYIAALAMQGLLANADWGGSYSNTAWAATYQADQLLSKLEDTR